MARLLGLTRGESRESPREITRTNLTSESGESGWLIRFFDSAFFCEWIAVSYLYKHDHAGVRDYLCNRMYTLPHSGIESYLFQICYMLVHKPSPSLDRFVIDICSKSLKIALKVHWFLMAELEDSDDNEGISRIQEKCQIAATLMGNWPPLVRPPDVANSPGTKNMMLNKFRSSKQKFLSLTCSPPTQRSFSFSPSNTTSQEEGAKLSPDEKKLFKRFIPSPKVRDALLFRKSTEKDEDDSGKDGFFRKLLRDSNSKDEVDELTSSSSDGFLKRLFRDSKNDLDEKVISKSVDEDNDGFLKKLFREKKLEDKKDGSVRIQDDDKPINDERGSKSSEDDKGFFRKIFKDKFEDKKDGADKADEEERVYANGEEEEHAEISLFRKWFRVHREDAKSVEGIENNSVFHETSPGTEKFFRKLFKDRDRSVEDSELFGSEKHKEKRPGSPKQQHEKLNDRPPPHSSSAWHFRKGTYHESLDFVQSLCDTSYGLVDIFPVEDRKSALRESLLEINSHVADAQNCGGVCFPMGRGMFRVVNIPVDEAILLNSREKAPYLICVEVMKGEIYSNAKDVSSVQKYCRGGIPLANGDALLPKPPPWACPLRSPQESSDSRMSRSTSKAIDQAMAHMWDAKVKFVNLSFSFEKELPLPAHLDVASTRMETVSNSYVDGDASRMGDGNDLKFVRVALTADFGVRMEDIDDQEPSHRKEHRRVPSTVAMEEVKAAAVKGEAPPGLPLKGAGQDPSDSESNLISNGAIPNATDPLSGELWEVKKDRIRNASTSGKLPNWDLRSIIVKSGDDCRQEHLAVQLISHFYDIFQEAGLPLWLRPYEVLVTSSYTALIETIPDTASLHSIKGRFPGINSLRGFFIAKYQENSPSFKLAQRNFVESMAGYSLVCYLLQVKDRHNGNLLMDEEGHIIHIDFGFMLSNSPGGVNFESAPFKLTRELLEVMDSDAEGVPSEFFDYFKVLCIQGFLTCRKHAERIILLVEMLQESGFPCFKGGARTIQNLRKRFHLSLTEEQCVSLVLSLISASLDAWRTRQYDYYQRVLNGIL